MDHHVEMEFTQITDQIFIGSNSCCQVDFKKGLLDKGVRADISLEIERIDKPIGVEFFLWLPTVDNTPSSKDQYLLGIKNIKYFVDNNIKVYVHCKNGHGRAPAMVAAFFISTGLSVEESIAKIKEKRPEIHLEDAQLETLKNLANSLNN